jgi:pimeloyl-ACP methyl ester carboxylesterase
MTMLRVLRFVLRGAAVLAAFLVVLAGVGYAVGSFWIARAEPDAAAAPGSVPGRLLDVGAHPVHVVERGSGPALVLIHGFGASTYDWEEHVLEPLARSHRVVAIDLFGMGFSARDEAMPYGLDLWVEQVRGTLDDLGIERAVIAGHSLGGAVATAFAVAHPERTERLVLVAPLVPTPPEDRTLFFTILDTPGAGEVLLGWYDHLPALPGFSAAYHARARQAFRIRGTRRALLRWVRQGYDRDALADTYRRIAVPTLVIAGRGDDIVPWPAVERTATGIDGALVLPLDGSGHWLLRDAPERVVEAMRQFLDGPVAPAPDAPVRSPS